MSKELPAEWPEFVKSNYGKLSIAEIAQALNCSNRKSIQYLITKHIHPGRFREPANNKSSAVISEFAKELHKALSLNENGLPLEKIISRTLAAFNQREKRETGKTHEFRGVREKQRRLARVALGLCYNCGRPIDYDRSKRACVRCLDTSLRKYRQGKENLKVREA